MSAVPLLVTVIADPTRYLISGLLILREELLPINHRLLQPILIGGRRIRVDPWVRCDRILSIPSVLLNHSLVSIVRRWIYGSVQNLILHHRFKNPSAAFKYVPPCLGCLSVCEC